MVIEKFIEKYGIESQKDKSIEEMGELIAALMQERTKRIEQEKVKDEIIDVWFMMLQLMFIYDITEAEINQKIFLVTGEHFNDSIQD